MLPKTKANCVLLWRTWIKPVVIVIVVTSVVRSAVADWNVVPSGSMRPSIVEGDRIWVNKLAYGLRVPFTTCELVSWSAPRRSDVVVFYAPGSGKRMVKRVIGLPGDTIELRDNQLIINGQSARYFHGGDIFTDQLEPDELRHHGIFTEDLAGRSHPVMITPRAASRRYLSPVTVPQGHYFVMGDNRDRSRDSRWFGFVPREQIVGRSSRIILSLDPDNSYLPRRNRFFRSLP